MMGGGDLLGSGELLIQVFFVNPEGSKQPGLTGSKCKREAGAHYGPVHFIGQQLGRSRVRLLWVGA